MKEVLILEDKEESRRILEELVKQVQPDADVYAVSGEDEAYAIAMKRTIDLFLVDIILHPETMGDQSEQILHKICGRLKSIYLPLLLLLPHSTTLRFICIQLYTVTVL